MPIDLHTHSSRSDGTATPTELVAEAVAHGLDVVALTDHDTVEGWQEAAAAAVAHGITLVRGIELSTRYDGRSVHLLAYLPDPSYQPLAAEMARVRGGRESRLPVMMERLRALGIDITEDDVRDGAAEGAVLGRPHVADALVGKGVVGHRNEAFEKMLGPGGPAFVPRYATSLPDAVELVRAAGGVPVVAHPWGRNRVLTAAALADAAAARPGRDRGRPPGPRPRGTRGAAPDRRRTSGWSPPVPATGTAPARSTTSSAATRPTPRRSNGSSPPPVPPRPPWSRRERRRRGVLQAPEPYFRPSPWNRCCNDAGTTRTTAAIAL